VGRSFAWTVKRTFDVVVAGTALVVLAPLIGLISLAILVDSGRPIFFRQQRIGRYGEPFEIWKFRTMIRDRRKRNVGPPSDTLERRRAHKSARDPRLTRVGRFLRRSCLDEIPQFWNILKGEMSFVGPRPERPHFVSQLAQEIPYYDQRHLIAPGLTGWAQIKYPYGAPIEDARQKLQYDLFYIKNQSLTLDFAILFETIKTIIFKKGAQ